MELLQRKNFQKCIDVVEDFHQSLSANYFDQTLKDRKKQAELAMAHIRALLRHPRDCEDDGNGCKGCNNGQTSITPTT